MDHYVTGYYSRDGFKSAIVAEGHTLLHICTMQDNGLQVREAPKAEARRFTRLTWKGSDYPLARACKKFLAHAKTHGSTQGALALVKAALDQAKGTA